MNREIDVSTSSGSHRPSTTYEVIPARRPVDADVVLPGSKSLTNRALVAAALAEGVSEVHGLLFADDTEAMLAALGALGVSLDFDREHHVARVTGLAGGPRPGPVGVDVRLSGTTARFVAPLLALGRGDYVLDGAPPFRSRPMGPVLDALEDLGAGVSHLGRPGHLPVRITADGVRGGRIRVPADVSSQFLSGLLLAAPAMPDGLEVEVPGPLVSQPYVAMTMAVIAAFGGDVEEVADPGGRRFRVRPTGYRATRYDIEPDASAASYVLAAAALTGGRVRVPGLGRQALQGDVAFADLLGRMGADVRWEADAVEVRGPDRLNGITVDMADVSDVAQTLAAVAVFADGPTQITGIGFIRHKETDRVGAVVRELRGLGIDASEDADGFTIRPGTPRGGVVATYDDHRMAMSFALLGLRVPGIRIADPGCVAKTFPDYFQVLEGLVHGVDDPPGRPDGRG